MSKAPEKEDVGPDRIGDALWIDVYSTTPGRIDLQTGKISDDDEV